MISVLIPSLTNRIRIVAPLITELMQQSAGTDTEIIINTDNKKISTGEKRNHLLRQAKGDYVIFVDDDDWVYPCYIEELIKASKSGADCFGISGIMTTNGQHEIGWQISKDFENKTIKKNGADFYIRKTNHITAVKRHIALQVMFPDKSNAEDKFYSDAITQLVKTEYTITPLMYHYRYETGSKEYV